MQMPTMQQIRRAEQPTANFWWPVYYFPSGYIVWISTRLGLNPNHITLTAVSINLVGTLLFLYSDISGIIIVVCYLIFNLAHTFDFADGQLAFVSDQRSHKGAWLDSSLDIVKIALITSCYTKLVYGYGGKFSLPLAICALAATGNLVNYSVSLAANSYRSPIDPYTTSSLTQTMSNYSIHGALVPRLLSNVREYGNFLLIFIIFAVDLRAGIIILALWGLMQWILAINRIHHVARQLT